MHPQQPRRQNLPRSARIRARSDFDRIFAERTRASDAVLTVYLARNDVGTARLGIAASRRLGNAVARNQIKRLIREAFRSYRAELPPGTDWVVVPKWGGASLREVDGSLRGLTRRLIRREREEPGPIPG